MNNFQNQNWNKNNQNQPNKGQDNQTNFQNSSGNQPNKGLFSLPPSVMSMLPWIPFALEAMTGQKIPQMTGTMAEIQQGIQIIQMNQNQIITHQQNLDQRLTSLEKNASNQFTNLANQVQSIKSIRLTHDRERKQIDYNLQQEQEN